jgi:subtilisin family serine protease
MKRLALPLVLLVLVACQDATTPSSDLDAPTFAATQAGDRIPDHYIVVLQSDIDRVPAVANEMARQHAGSVLLTYQTALRGFSMRMSAQAAARLARDPRVAYVEQDQAVTLRVPQAPVALAKPDKPGGGNGGGDGGGGSDPCAGEPNHESHAGLWGIRRVYQDTTLDVGSVAASGVGSTVWVIDTGIDPNHCDLLVGTNGADFTGSRKGWQDEHGHGTHVAGTIGAKANDIGVVGVAAGATVEAVRVLDRRGSGRWSWVIGGIDYVAEHGQGDVANMSLGGPRSQAVDDAVTAAADSGVIFALAAGNESDDAINHSPARAANGTTIFAVSAFAEGDTWASFSNYGSIVNWAEPGVGIASTYKDNGYVYMSGTSMASPHLAGLLALGAVRKCGTIADDPDNDDDPVGCN